MAALPQQPADLPRLDVVLISHNHFDHLDVDSVQTLAAKPGGPPLFIVPQRLQAWFAALGIRNVVELDWCDSHRVGEVEFVLTPAQHWSSRRLLTGALPCGVALRRLRPTFTCYTPVTLATAATLRTFETISKAAKPTEALTWPWCP